MLVECWLSPGVLSVEPRSFLNIQQRCPLGERRRPVRQAAHTALRGSQYSPLQAVAYAERRVDAARSGGRKAQLLPEVGDVGLEQGGVGLMVVAPGLLDQPGVGHHPPHVHRQDVQDAELQEGKLHRLHRLRHLL